MRQGKDFTNPIRKRKEGIVVPKKMPPIAKKKTSANKWGKRNLRGVRRLG